MSSPRSFPLTRARAGLALATSLLAVALVLGLPLAPAHAGSGRGTLYAVTSLGGDPPSYRLTVNSTSAVTVGDHVIAKIAGGQSGVWVVTAKTATTVDVADSLTELTGVAYGAPVAGGADSVWAFSTPTAAGHTLIPDGAQHWAAALRRNTHMVSAGTITAAALTRTNDTNVTLTLGGTPSTALVNAASLTLGWSGTLAESRGGTGASSLTVALDAAFGSTRGSILTRGASGWTVLAPSATSGQALCSNGTGADPSYQTVSSGSSGAALTKADDTNVTLTLGGTPATAVLQATSITAGWTGTLAVARGGTGASDSGTARTNLGLGSIATQAASNVAITGGSVAGITDLAVADGGTGASDAATARTNLGLAIGTDVQAQNVRLADVAAVGVTDNAVLIGNGTNLVLESGATLKTSLGLTIGTDVQAYDAQLADVAGVTATDGLYLQGNGTNLVMGGLDMGDATAGTLTAGRGGTGTSSYAQGDILYANGTSLLAKLAAGTAGQYLRTGGSGANPSWASGLPIQAFTAITAGTGSPTDLTGTANGTTLTNSGTTVKAACTLPSAAAGMSFYFVNVDSDGFRINAATGDVINLGDVVVSASAGYVESVRTSSSFYLVAVDATNWYGFEITGTWRKDSTTSAGWAFTRTAWTSATFTMTWVTNASLSGRVQQAGNMLYGYVEILVTGAVTAAALTIDLPSGYLMDFTTMGWNANTYHCLGMGMSTDISAVHRGSFGLASQASDTNTLEVLSLDTTAVAAVNQAAPNTWANGDNLILNFAVAVQ